MPLLKLTDSLRGLAAHVMMAPMRWRPGLATLAMTGAVLMVVSACSWRMDTPPEPFRTPSPVTVLRDQMAAAETAVGNAAANGTGPVAEAEEAAVPVRLTALGGVSPTSSPRASTDLESTVAAASAAARDCMDGADHNPLGGLCASILLAHTVLSAQPELAQWDATDLVVGSQVTPPSNTAVTADTVSRLALEHDQLRALYEVIAARSKGAVRTSALASSSAERTRVAALLAVPGVSDLTEPAYQIPVDDNAALTAHTALAHTYAALLIGAKPQDRAWLLNSAFVAYEHAISSGMALTDVPALPGAHQPSPSATP